MRRAALLTTLLWGCSGPARAPAAPAHPAPPAAFSVSVDQGGRPVPVTGHRAALARAPFDIVVNTRDPREGILMNVSFDGELYRLASEGAPLIDYFQPGTGMAEEAVIKDPTLMVGGRMAHHYLLYDPTQPINRYHEVQPQGGGYRCVRRVARLIAGGKTVELGQTREPTLYLVFFLGRKLMGRLMERHRVFLALDFR